MGLTYVWVHIANPAKLSKKARLKMLLDSGAVYSVVPCEVLTRIGIRANRQRSSLLADGSEITRRMGDAQFVFQNETGSSPVIFGEKGDAALLGAVSLEALGLVLDPFQRKLMPMPMLLSAQRPSGSKPLR